MSINKRFSGAFSMGTTTRMKGEEERRRGQPGPGAFNSTLYDKPSSPKAVIGNSEKGLKFSIPYAPSPDAYQIESSLGQGRHSSIQGRHVHQPKRPKGPVDNYDWIMTKYGQKKKLKDNQQPKFSMGYNKGAEVTERSGDPNGPGMYYKDRESLRQQIQSKKKSCQEMREVYRQLQNNSQKINWKKTTKKERSLLNFHSTGFISNSLTKTEKQTGLGYGQRPFLQDPKQHRPGPGEYEPSYQLKENSRHFKIGEKGGELEESKILERETPGPSTYQLSPKKEKKGFSITGKKKNDLLNIDYQVPGSQKYFPQEVKTRLGIKFGHGQRSSIDVRTHFQKTVPGPGSYYKGPEQEQEQDENESMSSLASQCRRRLGQQVSSGQWGEKAKGNYSFSKQDRMGRAPPRERGVSECHGAIYNYVNNYKKTKASRNASLSIDALPPQEQPVEHGRSFQLRGRGELPNKVYRVNYPGPGGYEQSQMADRRNMKQGLFLKSDRFKQNEQPYPGPGSYDSKMGSSTVDFSFPPLPSSSKVETLHPGPADYDLKSTIALIPEYLAKSASAQGNHLKPK